MIYVAGEESAAQIRTRAERLAALDERLANVAAEQARFNASDRDGFLLAEAEYLLRLANQRLIMASDTESAAALLASAPEDPVNAKQAKEELEKAAELRIPANRQAEFNELNAQLENS